MVHEITKKPKGLLIAVYNQFPLGMSETADALCGLQSRTSFEV